MKGLKLEDMIVRAAEATAGHVAAAKAAIGNVIFGQEKVVEQTLITVLCGGHGMLVGVPGLAKTKLVETLGIVLGLDARRIQFTPDLMPSDILGSEVLDQAADGARSFRFIRGPVFAQLLMADEINRASPRTQLALLQSMQEKHVTVAGKRYDLPGPFHVLATQNPLEQEGTYPLPEAQVDRFMLKVVLNYPTKEEEKAIVNLVSGQGLHEAIHMASEEDVLKCRKLVNEIYMDDKLLDYIVNLVAATRDPAGVGIKDLANLIEYGASPRTSISLAKASKAHALLRGRGYVTPQDVKSIGMDVLRHRVAVTYEAEAEDKSSEDIVQKILDELAELLKVIERLRAILASDRLLMQIIVDELKQVREQYGDEREYSGAVVKPIWLLMMRCTVPPTR